MAAPSYYERQINGVSIQVSDITHAWNLDSDEAQAVQYILRGKFKNEGKDEIQDLEKAINMLKIAVMWKEKVHA